MDFARLGLGTEAQAANKQALAEASMSLRLKPDQTAVITLPRDDKEQSPIFMMLKARLIETDP